MRMLLAFFGSLIVGILSTTAALAIPSVGDFVTIGTVTNSTNPSAWQSHSVNVTSFVTGSALATLTFDFRNDASGFSSVPNTSTTARMYLASEGAQYFMNFEWIGGLSSSHFRDVRLNIDGLTYVDQYGAFSNHLGDSIFGTARDGIDAGTNILGETGFLARTYVLGPSGSRSVPEPGTVYLLGIGFGLFLLTRTWYFKGLGA